MNKKSLTFHFKTLGPETISGSVGVAVTERNLLQNLNLQSRCYCCHTLDLHLGLLRAACWDTCKSLPRGLGVLFWMKEQGFLMPDQLEIPES